MSDDFDPYVFCPVQCAERGCQGPVTRCIQDYDYCWHYCDGHGQDMLDSMNTAQKAFDEQHRRDRE